MMFIDVNDVHQITNTTPQPISPHSSHLFSNEIMHCHLEKVSIAHWEEQRKGGEGSKTFDPSADTFWNIFKTDTKENPGSKKFLARSCPSGKIFNR